MTERGSYNISAFGAEYFELFLQPVFFDSDFRSLFRFVPTKLSKVRMDFASKLQDILKEGGKCGFNPKGDVTLTNRCIELDYANAEVAQCFNEFTNSIYEEALNAGVRRANMTDTFVEEIMLTRFNQAIRKDLERIAFFGDKMSTNPTLKIADGIWTKYIPQMTANPNSGVRSINAGSGAFAAGDGINLLRNVYENQSDELAGLEDSEKFFLVSNDVYNQYLRDREDGTITTTAFISVVNNGQGSSIAYRNIRIIPMRFWSQNRGLFPVAPAAGDPLRAVILTTRDNLIFAGDVEDPQASFEAWYDRDEREHRVRTEFKVGFNYVHETFFSVAYEGAPDIKA